MTEDLGRYKILEEIGQGGFAIVYRASDTELDRLVALKELKPTHLHDTEWVKDFKREARTIARLDHPRIVTIHDVIEVTERLFIVMRLVDGSSLDGLIATQGGLPWVQVVETITAVAEGLDYAHSQGILHRDLKPANILPDSHRGALLSDFGLAKLVSEASTNVTASGGVVGTPHYIAPEVWEGQGTTPQSDIYALGCILYEMVTGEKLFGGESPPAVMMAHFSPLSLPSTWPEDVPSRIADVLKTALAKKPGDRYDTAGEMVQTLTTLEGTEPGESEQARKVTSPVPQQLAPAQEEIIPEALAAAREIKGDPARVKSLATLVLHLPKRLIIDVAQEVFEEAWAIKDEEWWARWLIELAPYLTEELLEEALVVARIIKDERILEEALTGLAPHFSELLLQKAVTIIQVFRDEQIRTTGMIGLLPYLPDKRWGWQMMQEALAKTQPIGDEREQMRVFIDLAPLMSQEFLEKALPAVLRMARVFRGDAWWAQALADLIPRLPLALQGEIKQEALAIAQEIQIEQIHERTLRYIQQKSGQNWPEKNQLSWCPPPQKKSVLNQHQFSMTEKQSYMNLPVNHDPIFCKIFRSTYLTF